MSFSEMFIIIIKTATQNSKNFEVLHEQQLSSYTIYLVRHLKMFHLFPRTANRQETEMTPSPYLL